MATPWELEVSELKVRLAAEQAKVQGLEDRLRQTARQNAWLIVLNAADMGDEFLTLVSFKEKLREEYPALADALEDPLAIAAFRSTLV